MKITKDNKEILDVINKNDIALLYFSGENCGVCTVVKSKIKEILKKYPKIESLEIKTEENQELTGQYSIFTIPAIIVYIQGKESIREARYLSVEDIENKIDRYYNMIY